ncbi:hypothetical protein A0H76_3072 [Hepatospora eriocheir]|uniref:Uncharacterized protein n=1 Tax=Hepatospora eriocheir TaxID=1081669 RepID=A0A1X0Q5P9_9MICR|nr:hypothetical protein A0H76_3072 [Hepatospora eriocheir]
MSLLPFIVLTVILLNPLLNKSEKFSMSFTCIISKLNS